MSSQVPSEPDLLAIAERLLREGGDEALTMDALAAAAGLSRATVYRRVESREALLAQLAARGVEVGDRADVRSRILKAAGAVFGRLGLDGATVEAIAEAAGTGPATVYRHFGDKRGLISAYAAQHTPRRDVWRLVHQNSGDLRADLTQLITTLLDFLSSHGDFLRLALIERSRGSTLLDGMTEAPDRTIFGLAALLRGYVERGELAGEDPDHMARALMGMIFSFGMFGPLMGLPGTHEPAATARFIVRVFLDGLRTKKKRSKS